MSSLQLQPVAAPRPAAWGLEGVRAFAALCFGQVVSLFGAHVASFVIGVWVYQRTRSATDFALISFFTVLPEIALSPFAGVLVDRWGRRPAMLAGSCGAAACMAALAGLAAAGHLRLGAIYLAVGLSSAFQSVQFPALSASITMLVPRRHLSRANGVVELGSSLAMVAAPLGAASLLNSVGLNRVLAWSVMGYAVALATLMMVRIPAPAGPEAAGRPGILRDTLSGWNYVLARPELLALLTYFAIANFTTGVVQVLLPPLVLSFASPQALGTVSSAGGVGVLAGSLLVSLGAGPRRRVRAILAVTLCQGLILLAGVLQPSVLLIGAAVFLFLFCDPIAYTASQTIWQTKVAAAYQGRAFAIRRVLAWSSMPVAYLAAGPLADRVFEPLLRSHGPLAGSVGRWIGTGPGRGIALLFIILGALTVGAALLGYRYGPLRELEARLPDVAGDDGAETIRDTGPAAAGGEER